MKLLSLEPESSASANSAMPAGCQRVPAATNDIIQHSFSLVKRIFADFLKFCVFPEKNLSRRLTVPAGNAILRGLLRRRFSAGLFCGGLI